MNPAANRKLCGDVSWKYGFESESKRRPTPEIDLRKPAGWFEDHRLIVESSAMLEFIDDDEDGGEIQGDA